MEGQLEKAKQAALNLLRIGKLTLAEIAESVGLPMAEIQKIAR
jgi:DNA-directed RNA polymerase specialized sigma24 family protein